MEQPKRFALRLTHECGHQQEVAISDLEQPYVCRGCGKTDRVDPDRLPAIYGAAGNSLERADKKRAATGQDATVEWNFHTGQFE